MPRRLILSATERDTLLALPESQDDLIRYYTFNDSDLSLIRQRRGDANRLGFAVQLCLLRYPGYALGTDSELPEPVILWVAKQVQAEPASWAKYGERDVTRREHAQELRTYLQLAPFGLSDFRALVRELTELAQQTDKGLLLAGQALESLRQKRRILPALSVIDRACSEAIARANRRVYRALVEPLTDSHRAKLDELLKLKAGSSITWLTWLRQAPLKPNSRHMLEHIERLKTFQLVDLPEGLGRHIHQNRLLKLAREGGQMTPKDLGKFEPQRRYATLAAVVLESTATVIDELVDLHDRILVKLFSGAKHKHQQQFQKQGKAINDKVRLYSRIGQALLEAKESGSDPYAAIEAVIPWDEFTESVSEAELLARPEGFDHLHLVGENFATLRRYTPALLEVLELRAAPAAQGVLAAVQTLREIKMAESSPGLTYAKLSWLQAWHIRDETYSAALAELVNHQYRHAFAAHWGDGTTSSSDGQRFRAGGRGESTGHVNPKYGSEPGRLFYTHISDQYAPFSTRVVNVGVRDSTYVLDGLLYHESDLRIEEHYTDTAGFTDHVFALMHLLGFRFAPRIRDLGETKLYVPQGVQAYPTLRPLIGGTLNIKHVRAHWDDILRLASSIKQGTVTASLMLRKLGSYPRQNGLAVALRELGRIERTLFILDWLQSVELRRRVHAGLNKGEARNSLARAVFFNRLGEIRDRSFEQQRYRASGLNLVTAAIVLWNTVYLERATQGLVEAGKPVDGELLQFLSPLGWEHINLTGDYVWRQSRRLEDGKFRPLRMPGKP
ncbi:Tn3 family transposase [Escherichia coli]|nr:Tn3 family transposase [Salmonella enterica subsp. enterica serovar Kentucky]EDG1472130.1 Tn3 family transposase [Salmonella enterica subsp. enterica serovar Typhimurium]EDW0710409.1 Tn3 family transposase [Salmonella enterica subsp. enterica serovar 4,[5],12:i:-]EEQ1275810.1 Tn3 family transposase [Salmonella enterica]EJS9668266.1 Tn3 family transposase [Escherichia coli]